MKTKRFFQTQRLQLVPFTPEYRDFFYELNSNENVIRYTGDKAFDSPEEAYTFLSNYDAYQKTGLERLLVLCEGKPIGWCGLKLHPKNEVDLGFRFLEEEWGKGYATESATAMIKYAFEDLKLEQLITRVLPENKASIRVIEKLGFSLTGKVLCGNFQNALKFTLLNV